MVEGWKIGVLGCVLGVGGGLAASRWWLNVPAAAKAPSPVALESAEQPESTGSRPMPLTANLSADDKAELHALIREELGRAHADAATAVAPDPAGSETPVQKELVEMTSEQLPKFDRGRAQVTAAVARGTWSAEERDRLHEELASLPGAVQINIAGPLIAAINRQQVTYVGEGPPF